MTFILIIILISSTFCQVIDHQISREIFNTSPFDIKVFSDYDSSEIAQFNVYYKTNNSNIYLQGILNNTSGNYYSYTIPGELIDGEYLEYYILLETNDGKYKTIPENNPYDVPISLLVLDENIFIEEFQNSGLDNDVNIISPQPDQIVESDDVFIALSYFRMDDINLEMSQILIDGINMSQKADIRSTNLTMIPESLSAGEHQIKVILFNSNGIQYNPIVWNFIISGENYNYKKDNLSGKIWNDYIDNKVDTLSSYSNNTNFNLDYSNDWIKIKSRLKKSSLENNLTQAKDRYTFDIALNNIKIKYGDFYPSMNNFFISGNRVRGVGFNYKSNFFQIDLISGELARSVQGNPSNDAMFISDFTTEYDLEAAADKDYLTISRTGYTFRRNVSGLRIGLGNKANFGFNILKAKDDVKSVKQNIENAIISLPYDLEIFENFNSDQFIDMDGIEGYTAGDQLTIDYNLNDEYDDLYLTIDDIELSGYDISNVLPSSSRKKIESLSNVCMEFDESDDCLTYETFPLIQYVWDIKVKREHLTTFLNEQYNIPEDQQIFLEDQWDGDKPEDNLVVGTDFTLQSKNKNLKFRTSFAMSLLNENIWNPVKSVNEFDTYSDDYNDCEFGTTYIFSNTWPDDCTENMFDDDSTTNCGVGDYYWLDCNAYVYQDGIIIDEGGLDFPLEDINSMEISEQGIPLSAIPDPEDFEDIFHYNFDAIPTIPFYSLVQKVEDGESISLSDIFNAPEVAYDVDFSLKVSNNQIKFGIKQVGQSFNSLGNPYLQKDMREKYFSDRIRILENRMFLTFKFSQITNGISDDETPDISDKYDFTVSYYPGINLPSFNLSFANYSRKSGKESETYLEASTYWNEDLDVCEGTTEDFTQEECETDIAGTTFDTRLSTKTNNFNLSVNQSFESKYKHNVTFTYFTSSKEDLLIDELGFLESNERDTSYVSPRSRNNNLGVNLKTSFNAQWESNFNYSNSYFDYAQLKSSYYQKQRINSIVMSFNYKFNEKIEKIGAGIEYINGNGSMKYDQYSIRLYSDFFLLNSLDLSVLYNFKIKNIVSSPDYNNSLLKINISYRF